jgi:hypothetical protein
MFIRKTGDAIVCGFPDGEHTAVAHQNIYVVKAHDPELHWAVAAILNSSVATFLYRCGIHGQKGRVMAQFRVHALEAIPFPANISLQQATLFSMRTFLEDLIDACVMECYFRDHMAERDLLFHDTATEALKDYNPDAPEAEQLTCLETIEARLKAAGIPERLARIPAASPDLLGVILKEGKV